MPVVVGSIFAGVGGSGDEPLQGQVGMGTNVAETGG